jgi:hypothetical protein
MNDAGSDTKQSTLIAELPYLAMLIGAFIGIAIGGFVGRPTALYWQLLVPAYAVVCVFAGWDRDVSSAEHTKVVTRQAIHWLASFIAMRLLFLPQVRGVLNDNAAGLTLLTVLALSTFLAGLHAGAWRIVVVGIVLALGVPAAAWLEQSALLLTAEAIVVAGLVGLFLWARSRLRDEY